ncbi:uncharacterized protein LOC114321660 [Camellia sinensis]|uniref:uncharacterized protein LOC114321660 n=1 Tax=Camellia sinensis TaxID=4442 RepID=UPI001035F8E5|nr:uncharacterized protein LOC114321660 [Camellia sinensis]
MRLCSPKFLTIPSFVCLGLLVLFFFPAKIGPNLVPGLSSVSFWVIVQLRKVIGVTTLFPVVFLSPVMLPFLNVYLTSNFPLSLAPVSKEDLVYIDQFPSEVSSDEYISTVSPELVPSSPLIPLAASPSSASSLPSASSPPPLLVYSRCKAPPPPVVSAPATAPSASDDSDPTAHRYPSRVRHPPNRILIGFKL